MPLGGGSTIPLATRQADLTRGDTCDPGSQYRWRGGCSGCPGPPVLCIGPALSQLLLSRLPENWLGSCRRDIRGTASSGQLENGSIQWRTEGMTTHCPELRRGRESFCLRLRCNPSLFQRAEHPNNVPWGIGPRPDTEQVRQSRKRPSPIPIARNPQAGIEPVRSRVADDAAVPVQRTTGTCCLA